VQHRAVKLEAMLSSLIERGGYSRNRQPILDAVQISAAALSQYARGQTRPSFQKLIELAAFFGVSLDYLVHGEPVAPVVDAGPLARYVEVFLGDEYLGRYLVDDTGGNVLGATLDIWNPDCKEAARFGRHWGSAVLVARTVEAVPNDTLVPTRWDGLAKR